MGLILAIFATLLILFLVAAMAVAEWAGKDPGELLALLWKRPAPGRSPLAAAAAPPARAAKSVRTPRAQVKISQGKTRVPRTPGKNQAARKAAASKRKPR